MATLRATLEFTCKDEAERDIVFEQVSEAPERVGSVEVDGLLVTLHIEQELDI